MVSWKKQIGGVAQWLTESGVWSKESCEALSIKSMDPFREDGCKHWVPDAVVTFDAASMQWKLWVRGWAEQLEGTFTHAEAAQRYFVGKVNQGEAEEAPP